MTLPNIATRDEWLAARTALLAKEKDMTKQRDALNTERRNLPMVEIDKDYVFDGPNGAVRLIDMFEGRRQLIIYHFMFDPEWEDGCPSCTSGTVEISSGFIDHLHTRDTSYAMVSRCSAGQARALEGATGLGPALVLVVRDRLQLRLRGHDRREGRQRAVQLPHQGRVRGHGFGLLQL